MDNFHSAEEKVTAKPAVILEHRLLWVCMKVELIIIQSLGFGVRLDGKSSNPGVATC